MNPFTKLFTNCGACSTRLIRHKVRMFGHDLAHDPTEECPNEDGGHKEPRRDANAVRDDCEEENDEEGPDQAAEVEVVCAVEQLIHGLRWSLQPSHQ